MTDPASVWVGAIDLDADRGITSASGPIIDYVQARVVVRLHGAPIGYVGIAAQPEDSLWARASAAAADVLAESLARHHYLDHLAEDDRLGEEAVEAHWAALASCPSHFSGPTGDGISVVVCTRDRPDTLRKCLEALQRSSYEPTEFLVVDNAPAQSATRRVVADLASADPRIRYTCEPAPGLSRARNHGLAAAQFELIAFTDDDILVEPMWLNAVAAGFAADPSTACVTGPVAARSLNSRAERYFDSRYPWADAFEPRRFDLELNRGHSPLYPFNAGIFGTGANFSIRKAIADKLGGFDPLLGAGGPGKGGEDLDMFVRLVQAGYRISYLPAALVWHQHRSTDEALGHQVYGYGHGLGAYVAKRLVARDVSVRTLTHGLAHSIALAGRMRRAAKASQQRTRSWRLAGLEVSGVFVGAVRLLLAQRAARRRR
jgi:GT2 family glycosyltransferase